MVNEQDSVLGFPSGLKFWPYAFFRNVTTAIRTLHLSVNYMVGKTVKNLALPDVTLAPGEAREVVIRDIMTKEPEVADINLVFNYAGDYGDVLPATGSTDATANYVFPVRAQPVAKSGTKTSIFWLASGGFDTMYTVWNPLGISQELLATIHYGTKGEAYNLPLHLEPYASAMIDIGELMRTQQPDQEGKVIPFDVQHGSLDISHATGNPEDLITAVMSGGIYNPQKATCGATCNICSGMTSVNFIPNPFSLLVGGSQQGAFSYSVASGSQYDISGGSQWSSGATSIATVQTTGQSNPGLTTGVSPGGTTITALYYGGIPANAGQVCGEGSWTCPTISPIGGSGSAPVSSPFVVAYSSYIPVDHVDGPSNCTCAAPSCTLLPGSYPEIYMGDGGRGTYRTTESVVVDSEKQSWNSFFQNTGITRNYSHGSPANGSTLSAADEDGIQYDCNLWNDKGQAPIDFSHDESFPYAHQAQSHFSGSSSNPLEVPAPIQWDMRTLIDTTNPVAPTALVNYNHTCYPAHQIKVNGQVVYLYQPPSNDVTYIFGCLALQQGKIVGQQSKSTTVPVHP
ncbi:MAG TPA: hypothetical protein VM578_09365 [Candidatus Saccharimonadales bacterium]|nr:hypothetical protein [Candidatus Saccharimonadales bacterium]